MIENLSRISTPPSIFTPYTVHSYRGESICREYRHKKTTSTLWRGSVSHARSYHPAKAYYEYDDKGRLQLLSLAIKDVKK